MLEKIHQALSKKAFSKKYNIEFFLKDVPEEFFIEHYQTTRGSINSTILLISFLTSLVIGIIVCFFDFVFGLLVLVILFLSFLLLQIRKVRQKYFQQILEVEQFSDLICREISLILNITNSLPIVIEFLAKGTYPVISIKMQEILKKMNLGASPNELLRNFAIDQPSETIREFILDLVIPLADGKLKIRNIEAFEAQWRLHKNFDSYMSQIEGKMSIFLAITTIIPITVSMMLVMLGYLNIGLILFLPLIFFVLDLVALEIFNSGKVELLGGK